MDHILVFMLIKLLTQVRRCNFNLIILKRKVSFKLSGIFFIMLNSINFFFPFRGLTKDFRLHFYDSLSDLDAIFCRFIKFLTKTFRIEQLDKLGMLKCTNGTVESWWTILTRIACKWKLTRTIQIYWTSEGISRTYCIAGPLRKITLRILWLPGLRTRWIYKSVDTKALSLQGDTYGQ